MAEPAVHSLREVPFTASGPTRFPILAAQRPMWFGQMISPDASDYNIGQYTEITGSLDIALFRAAAVHVVRTTDALRLRFRSEGEEVWLEIPDAAGGDPLEVLDLSSAPDADRRALDVARRTIGRPFRLDREPPFRWQLIRVTPDRWYWCQVYHHAALDALSAWLVSERLARAYNALGTGASLPDAGDGALTALAQEEMAYLASDRRADDRGYWNKLLSDCERMRSWSDCPPNVVTGGGVLRETYGLSSNFSAALRKLAREEGVGTGHLLAAAAAVVQAVHQGGRDVILGAHLLGRSPRSARAWPGMTVNEGHLRLQVDPNATFGDIARDVARGMRFALRHQAYRYDDLRLDLGHAGSDPDLFSLSVNLMPFVSELAFDGLQARSHYVSYGPVRDLSLSVFDNAVHETVRIDLDGNPSLHAAADLKRHLAGIVFVLEQAVRRGGDAPLGMFALAGKGTGPKYKRRNAARQAGTLPELIARESGRGDALAVIDGTDEMSRAELDARSDRLARHLIAKGAGPETVVALGCERSATLAVAVLGILKAGAACLPLDSRHPAERSRGLLQSGCATRLVRTRAFGEALDTAIDVTVLDDPATAAELGEYDDGPLAPHELPQALRPGNLAFVLHTSGSTGRPKAVGLTHSNLVNKLIDQARLWGVEESSRFALSSSPSFDPSIHQLLLPLSVGGACVVAPPEDLDGVASFWRRVSETGVTHLDVVPSFAEALALDPEPRVPGLRVLILGGETLPPRVVQDLRRSLPQCRFFNMYGPTETCIDATGTELSGDPLAETISIGSSLANYEVHLLDECLRVLPDGVLGEIYVAGAGLARGYLGRPDLTAERYLPCPFGAPGERMYRTGDFGRRRPDGAIEFFGRSDGQIKLRGFRIEPGEIEAALRTCPGVHQAVVTVHGASSQGRLVAYVTALPGIDLDGSRLRAEIETLLPGHMVPWAIILLDSLPRMSNGKLDRRSLPVPATGTGSERVPPTTQVEAFLCSYFEALTSTSDISVLDSFFTLGGDSLLAMKLVARLAREQDLQVPLRMIFENPTPRALAAAITASAGEAGAYEPVLRLREGGEQPPLFCVHAASGLAGVYRSMAERLSPSMPVYGLEARGVEQDLPPHGSVSEMAYSYVEALRGVQPRGPYRLLGWSFGGVIAHEMTRILEAEGERVSILLLLDTYFTDVEAPPEESGAGAGECQVRELTELSRSRAPEAQQGLERAWHDGIDGAAARAGGLIARHAPGRVAAPLVFIRATDNIDPDLRATLASVATSPVDVKTLPVGHYDLVAPHNAGALAGVIEHYVSQHRH